MSKYLNLDIRKIHELLVEKKITPLDLVEEALKEIENNKDLNAFITINDKVREEASTLGEVDPDNLFFGIPIAVKDNIITKDMRTTCASHILDNFIPICNEKADKELGEKYERIKQELKRALNTKGWDGRWYKRAYMDDGNILGSMENDECRIDSIAQSWSIISNAGDNDKKYISMESLENHLVDKENGIIKLLDPPFEKGKLEPGYIKAYLPGVRENGGQYTHSAVWVIIAESLLGFGDKALELYRMINPIEHSRTKDASNKYKVEPYVIAADVYGQGNLVGRGGWTWYTGSSSWYYKAGIEYILGLKIENGYMTIDPCIPKDWKEYQIQYKWKDSIYHINVKNPNGKNRGVTKVIFDDNEVKNKIKLDDSRKIYHIEVIL